ncbi:MAG TPA: hypothetical protein VJ571_07205 [Candidatus Nitrosotalea sp.]|nr:hypothetical protein [Candidatus Nitrosotalea sp.]
MSRELKSKSHVQRRLSSLISTRHVIFFSIPVLLFCITVPYNQASGHTMYDLKSIITVNYANYTSTGYTILTDHNQNYTISQEHSWIIDGNRYNLQAYSIDNNQDIQINRTSNGNFTLNVTSNRNHSVIFFATPQFEIVMHGTNNVTFFPPSPTNDNWFDVGTDVQFAVPNMISSNMQDTRQILDGWSLDSQDINDIARQESGTFMSPQIHMSSAHKIDLEYKIQYYIKVISNFGRVLGTGWYDSGTIADASVTPGNDILVNHIFSGWQGSIIGNSNQESIETMVDAPKVLVANWSEDYTNVSIISIIIVAVLVLLVIYQKRKTPSKI